MLKKSQGKIRPVERRKRNRWGLAPLVAFTLAVGLAVNGCKVVEYVPVKGDTIVEYRDSIITRIDTVKVTLPPQKVKDYSDLKDTLTLRNDYSISRSWVNQEKGRIEGTLETTPKAVDVPVPVKEEYHQKDSIVVKEIPIEIIKTEYKTPKWCWRLLGFNILLLVGFGIWIYLKVKGKIIPKI